MNFTIHGKSMFPYLQAGDQVTVDDQKLDYEPGDLVLLELGESKALAIHRYLESGTKGDFNKRFDHEIFAHHKIVGKVVARFDKKIVTICPRSARLFALWSGLNHSSVSVFHRLAAAYLLYLGRHQRMRELQ